MEFSYSVFYSWQSDLPKETNSGALRHALREAANRVEKEMEDVKITLDEATRELSGSPNIPQSIFDKIKDCDIFVCDVTTINSDTGALRKTPNPNVLIELGYAIATVGWNRVILLFNKEFGDFPSDLPFDIGGHRAISFAISNVRDSNGKGQVVSELHKAIKKILEKKPSKPYQQRGLSVEQKKRERDMKTLKSVLSTIHVPTFEHFIREFPEKVFDPIFDVQESFKSVVDSSSFCIYDEELSRRIDSLRNKWNDSLSYGDHYQSDCSGSYYKFCFPCDSSLALETRRKFDFLVNLRAELSNSLKDFIAYVQLHYIEIDIDETNMIAFDRHRDSFKLKDEQKYPH